MNKILILLLISIPGAHAQVNEGAAKREMMSQFTTASTALDKVTRECNTTIDQPMDAKCVAEQIKIVRASLNPLLDLNEKLKNLVLSLEQKQKSCVEQPNLNSKNKGTTGIGFGCIVKTADALTDEMAALKSQVAGNIQSGSEKDPLAYHAEKMKTIHDLIRQQNDKKVQLDKLNSQYSECSSNGAQVNTSQQSKKREPSRSPADVPNPAGKATPLAH